ncbi:hypothetical protein ACTFIU_008087 [Dictyostelium citrinum]
MNSIIRAWPKGFASYNNTLKNIKPTTQLKVIECNRTIIKRFLSDGYSTKYSLEQSDVSQKGYSDESSTNLQDGFKEASQKIVIRDSAFSDKRSESQKNYNTIKSQIYLKSKKIYTQNDVFQICNKKLKDDDNGIDYTKFKEVLDKEMDQDFIKYLFKWCTDEMKTTNIKIIESFIIYYRKKKSMDFLKVLDYIDRTDMPQNILIINMTLFFYTEMNMIEEAKKLIGLLFSMGSSLPEKTYLAVLKSFERDSGILKLLSDRVEQDKDLGMPVRLYNEMAVAYLKNHRDIESALSLVEKLESNGYQLYQCTVLAFITFFNNNEMPQKSINLLKSTSDKYPEWFMSYKFIPSLSSHLFKLMPYIDTLLDHMEENKSISKILYNELIKVNSENASRNGVIKLYNRMIKLYVPDATNIKDLLFLAVRDNNLEECLYWYKVSTDLNFKLTAKMTTYLLKFFLRSGNYEQIDDIIAQCSVDKSICTPWNVGFIIYYLNVIKGKSVINKRATAETVTEILEKVEVDDTTIIDQSEKYLETYNKYYNFIKDQEDLFIGESTDFIIQCCLLDDHYEDAKRWYEMKIKDFKISPTRNTFSNFLSYHMLRMEHNEWTHWKEEMNKYFKDAGNDHLEQPIFDHFNKYYKNKKSADNDPEEFIKKSGTQSVMSKFYSLIAQKNRNEAFKYFEDCVRAQNKSSDYFIPRNFYTKVLESALEYSDPSHIKSIYKLYIEVGGIIPNLEIIQKVFDKLYKLQSNKEFQRFIATVPDGVVEEHYRIAHATTLAKNNSIKLFVNHLSKPENIYLADNDSVRNALLVGLLSHTNLISEASRLLASLLTSNSPGLQSTTLFLYLEKVVEFKYDTDLLALIHTHFKVNHIRDLSHSLTMANASVSFLRGDVEGAYKTIRGILYNPNAILKEVFMKLVVRVYSKFYPTPPDSNVDFLFTLPARAESMNIFKKAIYLEIFKCLIESGRSDLVRKFLRGGTTFTFVQLNQEMIYYILLAFKDADPEKVFRFAGLILRRCTITDEKSMTLLVEQFKLHQSLHGNTADLLKTSYPLVWNFLNTTPTPSIKNPPHTDEELAFINRHLINNVVSQIEI